MKTIVQMKGFAVVFIAAVLMMLAMVVEGANRRATDFKMPEYATYDIEKYNYELITDEDIWDYNVVQDVGVVNLTTAIYMD